MAAAAEDPRERAVQEILEAVIWPGESLIGFTQCRLNPGEFLDKTYYLGLTPRRFLLICKDQPERTYTIFRPLVEQARFINGALLRPSGLALKLGSETILLETLPPWNQRAMQIAGLHREWEKEAPYLTSTQFLESIADLAGLGLLRPAQNLLRKHMADDPVIEIEPRSTELDYQITQGRWALWLSLGTLASALFFSLARLLCGAAWAGANILPVILLFMAIIQLIRYQQSWRGLALIFALLAAGLNLAYSGFAGLAAGAILSAGGSSYIGAPLSNSLMWITFGATNVLALTGVPRRTRNLIAGIVFGAGFVVPLLFTGLMAVAPDILTPQVRFSDDFSTDTGWIKRDTGTLTSRIEDEAYAMHIKETGSTFFAFPPLHFLPNQVSLEARLPDEFMDSVGTYGVTCGYSESEGAYLVEIDPISNQFAFIHQKGKDFIPIDPGYWRPVNGTQIRQGTTRLEVRCENREISLRINDLEQGKVSVKGFPWYGKMGLFVRTWPESGPQGFKVLFDNVDFQRSKTK